MSAYKKKIDLVKRCVPTLVCEIRNNRNDRYYYYYCELTIAQISRGEEVVGLIDGGVGIHPGSCVRPVHDATNDHAVTSVRNRTTSPEKQNI